MKSANSLLLAVLFVFGVFGTALAQDKQASEPDWTISITTTGGFHGNGKGNFLVTSDKRVYRLPFAPVELPLIIPAELSKNCNQNQHFETANLEALAPLSDELFRSLTAEIYTLPDVDVLRNQLARIKGNNDELATADICSDCYKTTIRLTRREPDGKTSNFVITLADFEQPEKLANLIKLTDKILNTAKN
jgi:hypothetical protein